MNAKSSAKRDYFAELYVAGVFADAGWNVYFPKRDKGFDFVVTKQLGEEFILRPIQVKGKYPEKAKGDKKQYGYSGELTAFHRDMVLAIPYFVATREPAPAHIAYIPFGLIRKNGKKENRYYSFPAYFGGGQPLPRRDYLRFFDDAGLLLMEQKTFPDEKPKEVDP
jgi:hypothetical protein